MSERSESLSLQEPLNRQHGGREVPLNTDHQHDTLMNNLPGMAYHMINEPSWPATFISQGALELTGYPATSLTMGDQHKLDYGDLILPEDRDTVWDQVQAALEIHQPYQLTYRIRTARGDVRWVWERGQGVFDESGSLLSLEGFISDISELRNLQEQAEQASRRRGHQIQLIAEVAQQIAAAATLDDLFERVVTLTKERFGYYHTQLLRYDPAQDSIVLVRGYGETGEQMLAKGHQLPMGHGLIGTAAAEGVTVMRSDLSNDPDWQPNPLLPETKGEIAVPIKWQDEVLGVLDAQVSQINSLTDEDRLLLEGLCSQIAIAIHNTSLLQDVRTARERFELAVAGSNDGIWDWDIPTNTVYYSPRLKAMVGYSDDEFSNDFAEFESRIHPEDHDRVLSHVNDYLTGAVPNYNVEFRFRHKDGSYRWMLARGVVVRDEDGQPLRMAGSHTDVTERRQVEEALRKNEAQLSDALRITRLGNWEYDLATDTFTFNDNFYRVFHTTVEEVGSYQMKSEEYARRFVHPEDAALVGMEIGRALEYTGPRFSAQVEHRAIFPNGELGYISVNVNVDRDEQGNITRWYGANQDITDRKRAEVALKESELRYQQILDAITDMVLVKGPKSSIIWANKAFRDFYGMTNEQLQGLIDAPIVEPDYTLQYIKDDAYVFESGEILHIPEEPVTRYDGAIVPFETVKAPIRDLDGKVVMTVGVSRDITERKQERERIEQLIAERTAQLQESQQLLQLVMDNIPQAIFWKDRNLVYQGANDAFAEDAGFSNGMELVGKTDYDMPWTDQAELYRADDLQVIVQGVPKLNFEEPQTGATGQVTWLRTSKVPIKDENGQVVAVLGMYEDITEQKRLQVQVQEAFERRGYQVQVSTQIAQEISQAIDLEELFQQVVTIIKERLGYYHTQLLQHDSLQDAVILVAGYGKTGEEMLAQGHSMPLGRGLIGVAAQTGETVMRPNLAADPDWTPNPLLPETKGEIAVPIKLGNEILGVLDVQSDRAEALTEDDRLLLEGITGQIAIAIEQTRLRQEMSQRLEEVNRLYRTVSGQGWQTFLQTGEYARNYYFNRQNIGTPAQIWEEVLNQVFQNEQPVRTNEPKPTLVAPLKAQSGNVVGAIGIIEDQKPLTPEEQLLLEQISEQLTLALDSARLFSQTQASLSETQSLYRFSEAISREVDLEAVYKIVPQLMVDELNFSGAWLARYDARAGLLHGVAGAGLGMSAEDVFAVIDVEEAKMPAVFAVQSGKTTIINHPLTDERMCDVPDAIKNQMGKVIAMPLSIAGELVGVLAGTRSADAPNFDDRDERLLQVITAQLSISIERAQLFAQTQRALEETNRRSQEMATLNEMGRVLTSLRDVKAIAEVLHQYTQRLMEADTFFVALYDQNNQTLEFPLLIDHNKHIDLPPQPIEGGLTEHIVRTKQPLLLTDRVAERMLELGVADIDLGEAGPIRSWLGVPMIFGDQVIGVISVQSPAHENAYQELEQDLLTAIASQAAISIENARIFQRTQRQAEYEALINTISQRIQGTGTVEDALQVAVRELGRALGAKRANIQLGLSHPNKLG